ncbi:hypothetical protein [Gymnodinialimonas ulvae]
MPRRYIDYPDAFARWSMLAAFGRALFVSALLTLAGLTIRALLHRWRSK